MELLAPAGDTYQAGTLSGNPLATAAGLATLRLLDAGGLRAARRHHGSARRRPARARPRPGSRSRWCARRACSPCSSRTSRSTSYAQARAATSMPSAASSGRCWSAASICRRRSSRRGSPPWPTPLTTSSATLAAAARDLRGGRAGADVVTRPRSRTCAGHRGRGRRAGRALWCPSRRGAVRPPRRRGAPHGGRRRRVLVPGGEHLRGLSPAPLGVAHPRPPGSGPAPAVRRLPVRARPVPAGELGDLEAVVELADLISLCAAVRRGRSGHRGALPAALWALSALAVSCGPWPGHARGQGSRSRGGRNRPRQGAGGAAPRAAEPGIGGGDGTCPDSVQGDGPPPFGTT